MNHEEADAGAQGAPAARNLAADAVSKVAAVTVSFWILKILVTTVGDLCGDALSISLGLGYALALAVALAVFLALLSAQLRSKRFIPWLYWLVLLSSATVGAEISDGIDRALHWGNLSGTLALLLFTLVILTAWFAHRGALGSSPVEDRRDERYYWLAAIAANSLGSAFGDLIGGRPGWGLMGGITVNLAILALLLVLHYTTRLSKGLLFWTAFVVSRVPF